MKYLITVSYTYLLYNILRETETFPYFAIPTAAAELMLSLFLTPRSFYFFYIVEPYVQCTYPQKLSPEKNTQSNAL